MQCKEGYCWKAAFDEERNLYTAGFFSVMSGSRTLYEIDRETYDKFPDEMDNSKEFDFKGGRKLYMHVNDICGPPYTIVFDENYKELCPWADVPNPDPEETWPAEMTAAVSEAMDVIKNGYDSKEECDPSETAVLDRNDG